MQCIWSCRHLSGFATSWSTLLNPTGASVLPPLHNVSSSPSWYRGRSCLSKRDTRTNLCLSYLLIKLFKNISTDIRGTLSENPTRIITLITSWSEPGIPAAMPASNFNLQSFRRTNQDEKVINTTQSATSQSNIYPNFLTRVGTARFSANPHLTIFFFN